MFSWTDRDAAGFILSVPGSAGCSPWDGTMMKIPVPHQYFLQVHECRKTNRSKIKVKKWIDVSNVKQYEAFVDDWHYFLRDVQEILYHTEDTEKIRSLNLYVLRRFYQSPYDPAEDFYQQFYERLAEGKEILIEEQKYAEKIEEEPIMAVAEDYLLRSIQDLSRLISTLLLGKDRVDFEDLEDGEEKQKQLYQRLVSMADEGDINDAENLLSEEMEDNDKTYLELALSFYLYLNEFDDDFLA